MVKSVCQDWPGAGPERSVETGSSRSSTRLICESSECSRALSCLAACPSEGSLRSARKFATGAGRTASGCERLERRVTRSHPSPPPKCVQVEAHVQRVNRDADGELLSYDLTARAQAGIRFGGRIRARCVTASWHRRGRVGAPCGLGCCHAVRNTRLTRGSEAVT